MQYARSSSPKLQIEGAYSGTSYQEQIKFLGEKLQEKEKDYQSKKYDLGRVRDKTRNAQRAIAQLNREIKNLS